jgi:hypothetical protein
MAMTRILLLAGLMLVASAFTTTVAQAGTIDSGAMGWESSYADGTPGDVAGGTFISDEINLDSFSLWLGVGLGGTQFNNLIPVVMNVDETTGEPTTVAWSGPAFEAILNRVEYTFFPDLTLEAGKEYFIGVDSSLLFPGTSFGDFTIQGGDTPIAGEFWQNLNGSGWNAPGGSDIRTTVVMSNPEPGTATLLGMGLGMLGWARKNKNLRELAS